MAVKKKSFTDQLDPASLNPAMQFISPPESAQTEEAPAVREPRPAYRAPLNPAAGLQVPAAAPAGYRINPRFVEKKTRRVQLLLRPSVYEGIKELADMNGLSVNDLINTLLEQSVQQLRQ